MTKKKIGVTPSLWDVGSWKILAGFNYAEQNHQNGALDCIESGSSEALYKLSNQVTDLIFFSTALGLLQTMLKLQFPIRRMLGV